MDSLCKAIPVPFKKESKEISMTRHKLYTFLEVADHAAVYKQERSQELAMRKAVEETKKLQEQRQELKEIQQQKAISAKEKVGLTKDWKLERIYMTPEVKAITDLVAYVSMCPGSTIVRKNTLRFINLLNALKIKFEVKDISSDRKAKEWLLQNSKAENKRLTPQLFKGGRYLAQWEEIRDTHEQGCLVEFLLSGRLPSVSSY
mmetsp:Transcript_3230/g.4681  ORF Transcript_3230/g.4681 Transcript_3230/m.4681 type:complete len:203 (-) Transcript_3230:103-711(-)